jgi:hypothetical protein
MKPAHARELLFALVILAVALALSGRHSQDMQAAGSPPTEQAEAEKSFVVEYYYKAKWGHADEFISLFKKNHYPILRKQMELGRILEVRGTQPRYHTTEDGRWDYRITIVFKNAAIANDNFDALESSKNCIQTRTRTRRKSKDGSRSSMAIGICPSRMWT